MNEIRNNTHPRIAEILFRALVSTDLANIFLRVAISAPYRISPCSLKPYTPEQHGTKDRTHVDIRDFRESLGIFTVLLVQA
jgi:hypothetical protein